MKNRLIVKILKEGDQVLNVSHIGEEIHIVVRKQNEEVFVYSVFRDQNGQPKLSKAPEITITHGDDEVEAWATDASGQELLSITA
ncbi:hypothetical protein QUB63_13860 [Microcoleus sp. ARI1-B5]|uniref:hypothetical protein n=1 Tax=unclassified Microcoleus TaxID=2642155 RepID=UPI002FD3AFC7